MILFPAVFVGGGILQALRDRIRNSVLTHKRIDEISSEIWLITQQVRKNQPVSVSDGQVDPIWTALFGDEDAILGGIIWILLLLGFFQMIGILTLPRNKKDGAEQSHAEATSETAPSTASEASDS